MRRLTLLLLLLAKAAAAFAQAPVNSSEAIARLAARAEVIFTGKILSSTPRRTVFLVELPVSGCNMGQLYTLRHWQQPVELRAGQHYLMLLHRPGASGFSSAVGGVEGAIPLTPSADTTVQDRNTPDAPAATTPQADLRWLQTAVQRPVRYRSLMPAAESADNLGNAEPSTQTLPEILTQLRALHPQ